eukprot:3215619-Pyramimonas_sp.AAC.1
MPVSIASIDVSARLTDLAKHPCGVPDTGCDPIFSGRVHALMFALVQFAHQSSLAPQQHFTLAFDHR